MKWGDKFEVETPTFDEESGLTLVFRGTHRDCLKPFNLFYLMREPGLIVGKIKIPVEGE